MAGNKLSKSATDKRIDKCYELRYQSENAIRHEDWQKYCHQHYGDKSEITYTKYWTEAGNRYKSAWRDMLSAQLTPAVNELINLLQDENPNIRQKAVDQIFKYTGNDVQKIEHKVEGDITLKWGDDEDDSTEE